jgi:hypothetical protein
MSKPDFDHEIDCAFKTIWSSVCDSLKAIMKLHHIEAELKNFNAEQLTSAEEIRKNARNLKDIDEVLGQSQKLINYLLSLKNED